MGRGGALLSSGTPLDWYAHCLPRRLCGTLATRRFLTVWGGGARCGFREDSREYIAHVKTEVCTHHHPEGVCCSATNRHPKHRPPASECAQGIKQFLHIWTTKKDIRDDVLKWGDEVRPRPCAGSSSRASPLTFTPVPRLVCTQVEYTMLVKDDADGHYKLQCAAPVMLDTLNKAEAGAPASAKVIWHPEYSNWQIEATPAHPYRCYATDLLLVEPNMALRRSIIQKQLSPIQRCITVGNLPVMGLPGFVVAQDETQDMTVPGPVAMSEFFPDSIMNPHPRFATLTGNIRRRRGGKVDIRMPLFEDENTPSTPAEAGVDANGVQQPSIEEGIKMDAMAFGMGSCCLQVTLQARDVLEARVLYDQLGVMGPIMLALTAATPAWRGRLAATDVRWDVISQSVDCRTPGERGDAELQEGEQRQPKSRYAGFSTYIAPRPSSSESEAAGAAAEPESVDGGAAPEPEAAAGSGELPAIPPLDGMGGAGYGVGVRATPPEHLPEYDDTDAPINEEAYEALIAGGIDEMMARYDSLRPFHSGHFAHCIA